MDTSLIDQFDAIQNEDLSGFDNFSIGQGAMPIPSGGGSSPSGGGGGASIGSISGGVGDILSGVGSYIQGKEIAGADEYNAQLAIIEGQFEVRDIGVAEEEMLSTQKTMYAKSGVEMSGSVLDTALSTATNYEYDKEIATYNAQSQANMDIYDANMAKQKGNMALASGLISGAASFAGI